MAMSLKTTNPLEDYKKRAASYKPRDFLVSVAPGGSRPIVTNSRVKQGA